MLAGVLGVVTKLYSQGLFSGIRLIMSLIMFDLCTARWQETAANPQQTRPCRRGPGWLRSIAVFPAGGYGAPQVVSWVSMKAVTFAAHL